MRTVRAAVALLLLLAGSAPAIAAADSLQLAEQEGSLLHRKLAIGGMRRWDRRTQSWSPFVIPSGAPTRLYVVNVWSLDCKPCLAEFPLLQRIAKAWQPDPRVAFLFVADPPEQNSATALADLWTRAGQTVPDVDPLRSETPALQKSIELEVRPITLLVDDKLTVRQAFVGSVSPRNLGSAIERLLKVLGPAER